MGAGQQHAEQEIKPNYSIEAGQRAIAAYCVGCVRETETLLSQVIWTWSPSLGIKVHDDRFADGESEAREVAAPLFGPSTGPTNLGYHNIVAGRGAHLLWLNEDY